MHGDWINMLALVVGLGAASLIALIFLVAFVVAWLFAEPSLWLQVAAGASMTWWVGLGLWFAFRFWAAA